MVGSRIDAETLTRSRAMGIRGIVVAGLASKERRDFLASELRQRAALHRLPPYAVLVLDGAVRRPLSSPVMGVLRALAGREVAIVDDPPALVFDQPDLDLPPPPRTSSASVAASWPAERAIGSASPACAGSPVASTWRPARSAWPTGRWWPCPSAISAVHLTVA